MTFEAIVFGLCFLTSAVCAGLLLRAHRRLGLPLLLSSALCFFFLALNNLFVVLDILIFPDVNLLPYRQGAALIAVAVLIVGFIWDMVE